MKNKIYLLIGVGLWIAGCSSEPKRDSEASSRPTEVSHAVSSPSPKLERPSTSTPPSLSQALNDAIKSQNEDLVQQISSQMLAQNPKDVRALNALAMSHYRKGRYQLTKLLLQRALDAQPKSSELHNNLGLVELSEKNEREALLSFRKAVELNPDNGAASANMGALYLNGRDYKKAVVALKIASENGMSDWKTRNNLAIAYAESGNHSKAQGLYKDLLKEQPNNKEVLLNYSILLIDHMDQKQEGTDLLNKLRFIGPPPEARNRIKELENKAQSSVK